MFVFSIVVVAENRLTQQQPTGFAAKRCILARIVHGLQAGCANRHKQLGF